MLVFFIYVLNVVPQGFQLPAFPPSRPLSSERRRGGGGSSPARDEVGGANYDDDHCRQQRQLKVLSSSPRGRSSPENGTFAPP